MFVLMMDIMIKVVHTRSFFYVIIFKIFENASEGENLFKWTDLTVEPIAGFFFQN